MTATRNTLHDNVDGADAAGRLISISGNVLARNTGTGASADDDQRDANVSDPDAAHPVIDDNYVVDNRVGVSIWGGSSIVRDVIVGNVEAGLLRAAGTIHRLELNDFYGNGLVPFSGVSESSAQSALNRAIVSDPYRAEGIDPFVVVNHYWGAATGPGGRQQRGRNAVSPRLGRRAVHALCDDAARRAGAREVRGASRLTVS